MPEVIHVGCKVSGDRKEELPKCPLCGNMHILTCEQYSEMWECLCRLRNILCKIVYKRSFYRYGDILTPELKNIERLLGQISGIPDCCCEAYVNGKRGEDIDGRVIHRWKYVPCNKCENKIIRKLEKGNLIHKQQGVIKYETKNWGFGSRNKNRQTSRSH